MLLYSRSMQFKTIRTAIKESVGAWLSQSATHMQLISFQRGGLCCPLCRHYIADSLGYVCRRADMDYTNGCCKQGALHSCEMCVAFAFIITRRFLQKVHVLLLGYTRAVCCPPQKRAGVENVRLCRCHREDQCCSSYEHCVSCCMWPKHAAAQLFRQQFRIHGSSDTGHWDNEFQYCQGKCRTHQRSTEHENRYIDSRHFCFSDSGRPRVCSNHVLATLIPCCSVCCTRAKAVCKFCSTFCLIEFAPNLISIAMFRTFNSYACLQTWCSSVEV